MRTYGRVPIVTNENNNGVGGYGGGTDMYGQYRWVEVDTIDGDDSYVWCVTLAQCIRLNLNESPFFAQLGIPARGSVIQQYAPDFAMSVIQKYFSRYFASLNIRRRPSSPSDPTPFYDVFVIRKNGSPHQFSVSGVPT